LGWSGLLRIRSTTQEGSYLHLERVPRALAHEAGKEERVDMSLRDRPAAERHLRGGKGPLQIGPRIAKGLAVARPGLAESEGQSQGLSASAGTANALSIVGD